MKEALIMYLNFYRVGDYNTYAEAKQAKAVRSIYLDDVADASLTKGQPADIVETVLMTVDMMDGNEVIDFVLIDDNGRILDVY
jgi:hypothetical protein